jgi:predicted Rossmann fold nucleotide-binding protein DprA/Smf involved in DNA uptake
MTSSSPLSPDTQATLLLCGHFVGAHDDALRPLTLTEYNRLAKELVARGLRPADLLSSLPDGLTVDGVPTERLDHLLHRGAAMAIAVERWGQSAISVLGRSDAGYPARLRARLKAAAPPILFIAGNTDLFTTDAVCVVGSRDATDAGLKFARALGAACASEGLSVVSGDARGVDREAMTGALDAGGSAIGILAEALGKAVLAKRSREALLKGYLVFASPFSPESPFTVAHAMERNKYLYAMSLAAVVVDSDVKGGTWSGAVENHKHGWVPAYVRLGNAVREGNQALAALGVAPLTEEAFASRGSIRELLTCGAPGKPAAAKEKAETSTLPLFDADAPRASRPSEREARVPADDLFALFIAQLARFLEGEPRSEQQVAEHFDLEPSQARRWLERAHAQHLLTRAGSPPRYVLERSPL